MLRLRNRLLPMLRAANPLPSPIHPRACRHLSTSTSTSTTFRRPFSLEDYLVSAAGLTPAQAREVSKKAFHELSKVDRKPVSEISHSRLKSASNPDAILALLSGASLSRADIAAVISADPLLLRASVNNIAPRLLGLHDHVGLSTPQITRFLLVASRALRKGDVVPRLEFLISICGSFEKVLVVAKGTGSLLEVSLDKVIKPNIALLCQWGIRDIFQLCSHAPRLLTFNPEHLKECLLRAEQLGVPRTSRMFYKALASVASITKEKLSAKLEFFKKTLGCSESEVFTAVSKMPGILGLSDEILLRKIEFLVNEVAMEPRHIVERPVLQEKGLLNSNMSFFSLAMYGEENFKLKFIDCHKESVPSLADIYATARAGTVTSTV